MFSPQHLNLNFILACLAEDVSQEHFCVILCLYFLQSEMKYSFHLFRQRKFCAAAGAGLEWCGGTNKQEIIKINIMEWSRNERDNNSSVMTECRPPW